MEEPGKTVHFILGPAGTGKTTTLRNLYMFMLKKSHMHTRIALNDHGTASSPPRFIVPQPPIQFNRPCLINGHFEITTNADGLTICLQNLPQLVQPNQQTGRLNNHVQKKNLQSVLDRHQEVFKSELGTLKGYEAKFQWIRMLNLIFVKPDQSHTL